MRIVIIQYNPYKLYGYCLRRLAEDIRRDSKPSTKKAPEGACNWTVPQAIAGAGQVSLRTRFGDETDLAKPATLGCSHHFGHALIAHAAIGAQMQFRLRLPLGRQGDIGF